MASITVQFPKRRTQNAIFTLTRDYKCELRTNKLLEASEIKLKLVLENACDKPKLQMTKTVVNSPYGGQPGQPSK